MSSEIAEISKKIEAINQFIFYLRDFNFKLKELQRQLGLEFDLNELIMHPQDVDVNKIENMKEAEEKLLKLQIQ